MSRDSEGATEEPTSSSDSTPKAPVWLTPTGLPRPLVLAAVQLAGLVLLFGGCFVLAFEANYLGLVAIAYGVNLAVRPAARLLPRSGAWGSTLLDLVDRWPRRRPPPP
jgi:hypothetical protein